jgi:hypothetical protein
VAVLDYMPLEIRVRLAFPMLEGSVRAVRIETARVLASIPSGELAKDQRALLEKALQEYVSSQQAMAERPEAHSGPTQRGIGAIWAAVPSPQ